MRQALSLFVLLVLFSNFMTAQERWVQDPRSLPKPPVGTYSKLPIQSIPYNNPTAKTVYMYSPFGVFAITPNVRVLPNSNQQDEIVLVSQTANPNFMFGSSNTTVGSSTYGQGAYMTTNGGVTWYGTDLMPNEPTSTSDPAPAIDKNGVIIFTSLNTAGTAFMYGQYSTDKGVTWSTPYTITSASSDKNFTGTDDYPTSPYYGRSYTVWSNMALTNPPIVISWTTNSGVSWGAVSTINTPPAGHYSQGADIITGPGGVVYVTWAAPISSGNYTEDYFGFAKSTNGGTSWTVNENAFDGNGIRSQSFNGWGVRVNSFPRIGVDRSGGAYNGYIYIVTSQISLAPAGSDPDIVLHRSTDNGASWSAGVRVNQDALNNGKVQFFPAIRVDESGGVNIVYYDNRNYPSVGDSCETYVSRSVDGGLTWTDINVSDHRWKPVGEGGSGAYMGDYIGITSGNNKVWPFWFDNKTGSMQAWTCSIELGPSITHTPLGNTETTTGSRAVNAVITPAGSGINPSLTKLYYSYNNVTITNNVNMTNSSGTNWTAALPLSGPGTYRYYLTTTDSSGRTATSPSGAPGIYNTFLAMPDTVKPVIVHTPIGNTAKTAWPVAVTANVTDNIGVDSAWVKWRINSGATKQFKILNTSGSTYSALFNSVNADVNPGDVIYYRIFAQDNSSNHNRDSSALYNFTIINLTTACIGTGTVAMGSTSGPFNTYWYGNRTNMLWTSAEILANGGAIGSITRIGFSIATVGGQAMTGLTIRMQNTALTTLTGFTSTGWTTAYSNTYTVPGTGMQYIDLTTPFNWTGSNLLIEICFQNTTYSTATVVNGTAIPGMEYTEYHDLSTACAYTGFTAPTAQTARANVCFVITPLSSVSPINSNLPVDYNLSQNYPNPFNPTTKINFAIPKQGLVTLKIYDILGREVANLINEVKAAGFYSVDFNASELSSGVYFYRVDVNGYNDIKKMVLMK